MINAIQLCSKFRVAYLYYDNIEGFEPGIHILYF